MNGSRRRVCVAAIGLAIATSAGTAGASESFPERPVKIVVPYAPGGGPDIQTRQFAEYFAKTLGQSVVVENKIGAAGIVAAQVVAQTSPDGYTLLLGSNTHLIQKHLQPSVRFEPLKDFVGVGRLVGSPTLLVVPADSPYKTIGDLVEAARAKPGTMNFGSGGIGTSAHLAGASLQKLASLDILHVPLRGSVEIMPSLLRGDIHFSFPITGTGVPQVKGGKLRALAVTARARLKVLPEVPTLEEALGNPLFVQESWFGLWAPAGTPEAIVRKLHEAANKALAETSLQERFEANGGVPWPSESASEFDAFIRHENERWGEIVRLSGAKSQ